MPQGVAEPGQPGVRVLPVSRTHQASASLRLRATPASTSVSSTRRSGWRSLVITGTDSVVNISRTSAQVTPHDTLRRNLCSASRAISMRRLLVSSRNRRIRPSAAAARSASDAPAVSGAGSAPTIVISSRSAWMSGAAVNQSPAAGR